MAKRITIQDIATAAGVSKATVSRAVNDSPRVADATKHRIRQIIRDSGYQPNLLAKSIATKRTGIIGVIIPTFDNQFIAQVLDHFQTAAAAAGYQIMVATTNESGHQELTALRGQLAHMCDGIAIFSTGQIHNYRTHLQDTPAVFIDRIPNQAEHRYFDTVLVDNIHGSYNVVNKMIDLGAERIGIIANKLFKDQSKRLIGYQRALADHHYQADADIIRFCQKNAGDAAQLASQLLINQACDGIYATDSAILSAVLGQVNKLTGRKVLVGTFDDNNQFPLLNHHIVANHQPTAAIGRRALELLLRRIEAPAAPVEHVKLQTKLITK